MFTKNVYGTDDENNKKGMVISAIIHILILLILFLPLIKTIPEPEIGGVMISFGDVSELESAENIPESSTAQASEAQASSKDQINDIKSTIKDDVSVIKGGDKQKTKTESTKTINTADSKADSDRKAQEAAERARAEKEAKEKAEFENSKKKFSDLLGGSKDAADKNTGKGNEKGEPDGKALEGISKGSGRVGGGLSGRGVEFEPSFSDNSQKTGKVSLIICVNNEGKVEKAEYTQRGSTTTDAYLIEIARKTALKYRFTKSDIESQCGTVVVDFKVQ